MSSFIKCIGNKRYYCIDNFFGPHYYGFVEMTEEESKAKLGEAWRLLKYTDLEGRGGKRKVLDSIPNLISNSNIG